MDGQKTKPNSERQYLKNSINMYNVVKLRQRVGKDRLRKVTKRPLN